MEIFSTLNMPIICAPMFLVSGPELVTSACKAGIIGSFPAANARDLEGLDAWLTRIKEDLARHEGETGLSPGPIAVNFVISRMNDKVLDVCARHGVSIVITSVGNPQPFVQRIKAGGARVFHDVTTRRHAEKAVAAGVDGLILVCAGAGGHSGAISPFALLPEVKSFFSGPLALAGAISSGRAIYAAQVLGASLAFMGTRFIAARESRARDDYKQMILSAGSSDILYTSSISGLPANFIKKSIRQAGLDPAALPPPLGLHKPNLPVGIKAWKDIWSAGQGAGLISDIPSVGEIVARLKKEYEEARTSPLPELS